ncbi:MAG TPA: ATP-binding cassette domain-containing protein [Thermoanaerobaculia bacterium]|nr:ATP-binding cassette domain-containing protein [Thermoanaerobaculia bacterium]
MIALTDVTKRYGSTLAVDQVSFAVREGEIAGFLGPNGAGKSTVMRMISTWLRPTAGQVCVLGFDVEREPLEIRRNLGYLPEHNALYEGMRVDRLLAFMARIRGVRGRALRQRMEWVIGRCDLAGVLAKRVHQCSKGFRQRIGLAAALIHDPPVLVLDEPTHGLDPLQVLAFRELMAGLREHRTILFSSHILSELTAICERLLIIDDGRLLADTSVDALAGQARERGLALEHAVLDVVRAHRNAG